MIKKHLKNVLKTSYFSNFETFLGRLKNVSFTSKTTRANYTNKVHREVGEKLMSSVKINQNH